MNVVPAPRSNSVTSLIACVCLIALALLTVALAAGCCAPCHGCQPHPSHHGYHAHPRQYAEPQWPYVDPMGHPRLMGDSRLRQHLGAPPVETPQVQ
jgi:hypothetical protein